jgi:hypothetical protein
MATSIPPYDYWVSLYQVPGKTQVTVYSGNNAFTGAGASGPSYNINMTVTDKAGHQVCSLADAQVSPIPTGRNGIFYAFQITYPRLPVGKIGHGETQYTITAQIWGEHTEADTNHNNNRVQQTFTLPAGGAAACVRLPK